jgi:ferredoxin/flavodoxin
VPGHRRGAGGNTVGVDSIPHGARRGGALCKSRRWAIIEVEGSAHIGVDKEHFSMSTEIYYFSGTGNSLHVAKELEKRISETRLVPIVSLLNIESIEANAETVGFVFPQYAGTMPGVVDKFLKKIDPRSASYLFAIATRGGTECRAFADVDKLLKKSGRRLDSYFVLTMPGGSEPLVDTFADNITEERIARLESEMLKRLDSIQRTIIDQEVNREEDLSGLEAPPPAFLKPILPIIKLIGPILLPLGKLVGKLAESSFGFYFDSKCTGCGICERVCLAQRVKMVDERPVWQKEVKCYGCFACLNYCPEQSVQIKSTWYLKSCTGENGRYHHPEITANDIAEQKVIS